MPNTIPTIKGYPVLEANVLKARRTGRIWSQYELDETSFSTGKAFNGMILAIDDAKKCVKLPVATTTADEVYALHFSVEAEYEHKGLNTFAVAREKVDNEPNVSVHYPRMFELSVGDVLTTNCVQLDGTHVTAVTTDDNTSVIKYTVTAPAGITVSTASAQAGDTITVTMNDQTIAVNAEGREIARISGYNGTFTMPASDVTLSVIPASNMFAGKSPNSYVYVCDADMKPVMMRASNTGSITIRLGSGNAGKTVILYAEKNSTKKKLAEAETDEDGNVTLDIGCGKNYTLVIE